LLLVKEILPQRHREKGKKTRELIRLIPTFGSIIMALFYSLLFPFSVPLWRSTNQESIAAFLLGEEGIEEGGHEGEGGLLR
jgi:hypothetical protein